MISLEKFFEKIKDSGLSQKNATELYWSLAYCIILRITGKSFSFSEIEKEYLIQNSLLKKIRLEAVPANERNIIDGIYTNEKEIRQKVKTEKMAPHEAVLNNRISHYMLLLRFTAEDKQEAEGIKLMIDAARSVPDAPENMEKAQKRKGLLTIATLTALGVTESFILKKFVKKGKEEK